MGNDRPLVSVVLLSYNRPSLLKYAIQSIIEQSYKNLQIIVVDNKGQYSNEIEDIVHGYRDVRFIKNSENLGFAGGMNRGIEYSSGKYIYLTEDDLITEKDCIANLVYYMEKNASTGIASGIMYNKNSGTIRCAGGEFYLGAVYSQKIYGAGEKDSGQFSTPFNVTYISGAMMFSRSELIKKLGGFRQDFFMYYEDVELCCRVIKSGYKITIVPQAKTFHCEPPAANLSEEMRFYGLRNLFSIYILHVNLFRTAVFMFRYGFLNLIRSIYDKRNFLLFIKLWIWFVGKIPSLLNERYIKRNI